MSMIGVTYTDFDGTRIQYVFVYNRSGSSSFTFHSDRYGLSGTGVYAFDYRKATGAVLVEGKILDGSTSDWSYYIIALIGASGIVFLGDKEKIASCGSKRIISVNCSANQVSTVVAIEPKERSGNRTTHRVLKTLLSGIGARYRSTYHFVHECINGKFALLSIF